MTDMISFAQYAGQEGTSFQIHGEDGQILELLISSVEEHPGNPNLEQFSLFLHGPKDPLLQSGTYEVHHATLAVHLLYLSALARDEEGCSYQALFNRLK
ncbi:MAG: hypothetical protein IPP78_14655 [Holophagaceae bacterium]|nr:hypothetical protein [Holophagaceae bacterium]